MGIGCRRDPLEANVWYVKAADSGDERAKHRLAAIRAAASGGKPVDSTPGKAASKLSRSATSGPTTVAASGKPAKDGKEDKDCIVM